MAIEQSAVRVTRWSGATYPTLSIITRQMQKDGLRPYQWDNTPNHRYAIRSHGYAKVLYVVEGTLEIVLADSSQSVKLRAGDKAEIPAGVRHGIIVGKSGVCVVEAADTRR